MRDLNIEFQEKYKSVDKFIRDAYASSEGVSEYLRMMEDKDYSGRTQVDGWTEDYKELKHARWLRNQLAHDVSIDDDVCQDEDVDWIYDFYDRLFSSEDPLALLNRALASMRKNKPTVPDGDANSRMEYSYGYEQRESKSSAGLIVIGIIAAVIIALIFFL